jgi:hypothetical protein
MNKTAVILFLYIAFFVVLSCKKSNNSEVPGSDIQRIFTGEFLENRGTHALCKTLDNHFAIVAGKGESRQLFVALLDASLNTLWEKTYGSDVDNAGGIIETSDGGLLIASNKQVSTNPMQINYGLNLLKINRTGEIIWEKNYLFESAYGQDYPIIKTPDGGFVIGVPYHIPEDSLRFYPSLFKVNSQGDSLWLKGIPGSFNCAIRDMAPAAYTGFLIAASLFIFRTDSLGELQWKAPVNAVVSAVQGSPDGSVTGLGSGNIGDDYASILTHVDGTMNVVWGNSVGKGYDIHTYNLCRSKSGDFIMTVKVSGKVQLIKTDRNGQVLATQNFDAYNACGLVEFEGMYCCYTQRLNATHTNFDLVVRKAID